MIKRETLASLLAGFLAGACGIFPAMAGSGFDFGPAQGAASGGGGGSGDIEGVTAGNGLTGGGTSGSVTLNVAVSAGLTANADEITLDEELQDVAGTSPTDNGVLIGNGSAFVVESGATLKTSLGLTIGTDVQAYDEELSDVAGVTPTDNSVVAGNGSALAMETLTSLMDSAFGSTRGQILFRGSSAWQVLAVGTAGQVLESGGAGADVSWGTDGGGGGSALFHAFLDPRDGISPPGTSSLAVAVYSVRNGHPCMEFPASEEDSTQDDSVDFVLRVPSTFSTSNNLQVDWVWSAEGATSGNVVWIVEVEAFGPALIDLDSDSFDTAQTVTTATSGTDGNTVTSSIQFTVAEFDGVAAGNLVRIRLTRNSNEALDNLAVRAQVYGMSVEEEAP